MSGCDNAPWLSLIGVGEEGFVGLSPVARRLIGDADVVIGGKRHLERVPQGGSERIAWPSPMTRLIDRISSYRGRAVVVLASGDPLWFGVGRKILEQVPIEEVTVLPSVSAFSLAAARMGWQLANCEPVTVHGRPLDVLGLHVYPGARLLILGRDGSTPTEVAGYLAARGFGESEVVALSRLGGPNETRLSGKAAQFARAFGDRSIPNLTTVAVACVAGPGARWLPRTAGLPDDAFHHDGKMTKRDLRATALARLMPHPGGLLWDIGAGCGSVAIEWLRAANGTRAIALEPNRDRRAMAAANAAALGVPSLDVRDGVAPDELSDLPVPDAIFVGGGISKATIDKAAGTLALGGRLVAHAVTLESEATLIAAHQRHGGELVRHAVSHAAPVGPYHGWRPAMPVTQWAWRA